MLSGADYRVERKELPAELQKQWKKDRLQKAKKKNERELARLEAALDPLATKKGGKKSKKAMVAAARLDPSIKKPHKTVDMVSVEQQMRRLLAQEDGRAMALPVCDIGTRKNIHTLAALFGLKSKSKDGALGRYVTLFKKKRSGKNVDEREVKRLMEQFKYRALYGIPDDDTMRGKGKGKGRGRGKGKSKEKGETGHLKTREGDVVGHVRVLSLIEPDFTFVWVYKHILYPGCTKDRRNQHRVCDAGIDGLVRWRDHRVVRRIRCSTHSGHQEDQAWVGCWRKRKILIVVTCPAFACFEVRVVSASLYDCASVQVHSRRKLLRWRFL